MSTPSPETKIYDVVVIGGGAVGENVADRAVKGGLSAVIIESDLVGGQCSYWACMPSKALLRPGAALEAARRVPGISDLPEEIDVAATLASRDNFTSDWDDSGQVKWLESARIDLIRGTARLIGEREIEVHPAVEQAGLAAENLRVHARAAVAICTGTKPVIPPIPGLVESRPWTSAEAGATNDIPGELLIIGGGVVGCEIAAAVADLGSKVQLIARRSNLPSSI